jgi:hypothetical protein
MATSNHSRDWSLQEGRFAFWRADPFTRVKLNAGISWLNHVPQDSAEFFRKRAELIAKWPDFEQYILFHTYPPDCIEWIPLAAG